MLAGWLGVAPFASNALLVRSAAPIECNLMSATASSMGDDRAVAAGDVMLTERVGLRRVVSALLGELPFAPAVAEFKSNRSMGVVLTARVSSALRDVLGGVSAAS